MQTKTLKAELKRLGPWYHPIDFGNGVVVKGTTSAYLSGRSKKLIGLKNNQRGMKKWKNYIEPNLPISLSGARILDIGCNSGLFALHCLRQRAHRACGIDVEDRYIRQARFLKSYYEKLDNTVYDFRILQTGIQNTASYLTEDFDLCLMLNVFRVISDYDESVAILTQIRERCPHIIVQSGYGNKKDGEKIIKKKLKNAGYSPKLICMKGTRGVITIGKAQ